MPSPIRATAALFVLFCVTVFALVSCSMPQGETEAASQDETPDVVFYGFSREEVEDGVVVFSAKAEKAEYFEDQGLLVITNVVFEDRGKEGGSPKATGEAERAVYHEDTGNAEFSGYVRLYSKEENAAFEAKELNYIASSQTIEGPADDPVIVRVGQQLFLHGTGFFADVQKKAFSFRNGVQGTIWTETAEGARSAAGEPKP